MRSRHPCIAAEIERVIRAPIHYVLPDIDAPGFRWRIILTGGIRRLPDVCCKQRK